MNRFSASALALAAIALLGSGCTRLEKREVPVYEDVTKFRTVAVYGMVAKTREVPETRKVTRYRTIEPIFPASEDRPVLIAIIPFSSLAAQDDIAEETEDDKGSADPGHSVAQEFAARLQSNSPDFRGYTVLDGDRRLRLASDPELRGLDGDAIERIRKKERVEGLIVGHIDFHSGLDSELTLEAVRTSDASAVFTHTFRGTKEEVLEDAVRALLAHEVPDGLALETFYRVEEYTEYGQTGTQDEAYTVRERVGTQIEVERVSAASDNWLAAILVTMGVLGLLALILI